MCKHLCCHGTVIVFAGSFNKQVPLLVIVEHPLLALCYLQMKHHINYEYSGLNCIAHWSSEGCILRWCEMFSFKLPKFYNNLAGLSLRNCSKIPQ